MANCACNWEKESRGLFFWRYSLNNSRSSLYKFSSFPLYFYSLFRSFSTSHFFFSIDQQTSTLETQRWNLLTEKKKRKKSKDRKIFVTRIFLHPRTIKYVRVLFLFQAKISTRFINSTTTTGLVLKKKSNLHAHVFTCRATSRPRTSRSYATINLCSRCIRKRARDLHGPPLSGDKFWISGIHSRIGTTPVNLSPGLNFEDSKREQWKFAPLWTIRLNLSLFFLTENIKFFLFFTKKETIPLISIYNNSIAYLHYPIPRIYHDGKDIA